MNEVRDRRDKHWFWIDDAVIDQHAAAIGPIALALYVVLVRHADKTGKLYPSMRRLEHILGASRPTIRKHLQILVTHGLITHTQRTSDDGRDTSSLYTILSPPLTDLEMPDEGPDEGSGKEFTTSGKDLSWEGKNSFPSLKNFYPEGIGFKELGIEGSKPSPNPINGEQNVLEASTRGTIAESSGEHTVCSGDDSSMVEVTHPLPKNSRAHGTNPRAVAARQQQDARQLDQEQIAACPHCDATGRLLFFDATGIGYTNTCPHDLPRILGYVERHRYHWPHAPPPHDGGPAP